MKAIFVIFVTLLKVRECDSCIICVLNVSDGEIYISGKPVIDNQTKTLKLSKVEFSRKLDSKFWNATTQLLHSQLLAGLQDALVYDFSQNYNEVDQSINQQLNGQHGKNIKLNGQLDNLKILTFNQTLMK